MEESSKVIIYDTEGNVILNDIVNSPFVGLQTGESFWYGPQNKRQWGKVVNISYGIDTDSKLFVIEMVIEESKIKHTKIGRNEVKSIDYGSITLEDDGGKNEWFSDDKTISIAISDIQDEIVNNFVLIVEDKEGPEIVNEEWLNIGDSIICETGKRSVKCTLVSIKKYESAKFRIIEKRS